MTGLIGFLITLVIRLLVTAKLDTYNFAGFYRKYPLIANITSVAYECWHVAVMSGFALIRAIKLIIVIMIYLGRVDRPILADGVGDFGALKMDKYPRIFMQDLMSIEAHRHPYIERLGMMYMMKLKHGKKFACKAGSHWRLLFVFALMPHLRKNRILNLVSADLNDDGSTSELYKSIMNSRRYSTNFAHGLSLENDSDPSDAEDSFGDALEEF